MGDCQSFGGILLFWGAMSHAKHAKGVKEVNLFRANLTHQKVSW
jgi:hypothetical protein